MKTELTYEERLSKIEDNLVWIKWYEDIERHVPNSVVDYEIQVKTLSDKITALLKI